MPVDPPHPQSIDRTAATALQAGHVASMASAGDVQGGGRPNGVAKFRVLLEQRSRRGSSVPVDPPHPRVDRQDRGDGSSSWPRGVDGQCRRRGRAAAVRTVSPNFASCLNNGPGAVQAGHVASMASAGDDGPAMCVRFVSGLPLLSRAARCPF